jgi:hypothetical protein
MEQWRVELLESLPTSFNTTNHHVLRPFLITPEKTYLHRDSTWIEPFLPSPIQVVDSLPPRDDKMNELETVSYVKIVESYRLTPTTWATHHWAKDELSLISIEGRDEGNLAALLRLFQIRCCIGRELQWKDLEEFSPWLLLKIGQAMIPLAGKERGVTSRRGKFFVKLSQKSPKEQGVIPCSSVLDALNLLTFSKNVALRTGTYDEEFLAICPWLEIDPRHEWRVFVKHRRVFAISQQHCYSKYGPRDVQHDISLIMEWCSTNLVTLPYEETTLDIAVISDMVHLLECNPPTGWCSSGSALFDWNEFELDGLVPVRIY